MTRPIARIDDEIGMNTTTTISELSDYVDTGELRPQDDVNERTFVGYRDRAKLVDDRGPPFFSGREHEINVFRRMLEDVSGGIPADSTVVVEGPPGAGKTALMAQCIGEVVACPRTNAGKDWLPVVVHSSISNSAQAVGRAVDRAIASHLSKQINKRQRDALIADIKALVDTVASRDQKAAGRTFDLITKSGESLSKALSIDDRNAEFDRIEREVRTMVNAASKRTQAVIKNIFNRGVSVTGISIGPGGEISSPSITDVVSKRGGAWRPYQIVLFVDEGQNIPARNSEAVDPPSVLSTIHEGKTGASISLCVFGLPGTWNVLRAVGISRTVAERDITIGALPDEECAMAADRCFSQFNVRNSRKWAQAIVSRSHQWPQHLAGYLVAAMTELSNHQDQKGSFNAELADFAKVINEGDLSRRSYYEQRLKGLEEDDHVPLVKHLAHHLRESEPLSSETVKEIVQREAPGITKQEFLEFRSAAIHSGFLQFDESQQCYFLGIPSFAAFLLKEPPEPIPDLANVDDSSDNEISGLALGPT